ncbi:MAG TPA: sugar ABC transporter substrate-binding protein [Solirubrobacteraceae bacterium]|nr:sugar ABC transporter substrate-binding protein [Solirubrobacteraceae bacterium]
MQRAPDSTRRQFLRRSAAAGVVVASGGSVLACGGGDDAPAAPAALHGGKIRFLTGPLAADDLKIQRDYAKAFERGQPKIDVGVSLFDWGSMVPQLTTAYAGDRPPDLLHMSDSFWAKLASQGAFLDVTDYVNSEGYAATREAVPERYWDALTYQDKIWGVPWLTGVYSAIYVNKDLMAKAGVDDWSSSYDAMREAARATTEGKTYGYAVATTFTDFAYQELMNYVFNSGADFLDEEGRTGALDTPEAAEAMEFLRVLHVDDKVTPPPGQYDRAGQEALFRAGRVAMYHSGGNAALITGSAEGKTLPFDWDVYAVPPGPKGNYVVVGLESFHIASRSKHPAEAFEYAKYLTTPDKIIEYDRLLDGVLQPCRTDVADRIYPAGEKWEVPQKLFDEFHPKGRAVRGVPKMIDALRVFTEEFEAMVRGRKDGAAMVRDANAKIDELASA